MWPRNGCTEDSLWTVSGGYRRKSIFRSYARHRCLTTVMPLISRKETGCWFTKTEVCTGCANWDYLRGVLGQRSSHPLVRSPTGRRMCIATFSTGPLPTGIHWFIRFVLVFTLHFALTHTSAWVILWEKARRKYHRMSSTKKRKTTLFKNMLRSNNATRLRFLFYLFC